MYTLLVIVLVGGIVPFASYRAWKWRIGVLRGAAEAAAEGVRALLTHLALADRTQPPALDDEAIARLARAATAEARRTAPAARVQVLQEGPIGGWRLTVRAYVRSDADKAALTVDAGFRAACRRAVLAEGYSERHAAGALGLEAQSQETVDRDYGGHWSLATG